MKLIDLEIQSLDWGDDGDNIGHVDDTAATHQRAPSKLEMKRGERARQEPSSDLWTGRSPYLGGVGLGLLFRIGSAYITIVPLWHD